MASILMHFSCGKLDRCIQGKLNEFILPLKARSEYLVRFLFCVSVCLLVSSTHDLANINLFYFCNYI